MRVDTMSLYMIPFKDVVEAKNQCMKWPELRRVLEECGPLYRYSQSQTDGIS